MQGETAKQEQNWQAALPVRPVSHQGTLSLLVRGKNINQTTLLATDYLNHFNEIIMVLELLPDMPDCLEEAQVWVPKSYVEHFRDSSFADKELAILAYENAPAAHRQPFDRVVTSMDSLITRGLADITAAVAAGDDERLRSLVEMVTGKLRRLIELASAIIHGNQHTMDQGD
ncbi:MAG TPA: hypothetical protein VE631_03390, partial [Alphaproteobacteria bacterium]|nr:hypothetical protein [Alphaproteobacteria bacterium]